MMRSQQRETASRLLVLDDDPDIGQTVRNMAENLGYQCRVTTRPRPWTVGGRATYCWIW